MRLTRYRCAFGGARPAASAIVLSGSGRPAPINGLMRARPTSTDWTPALSVLMSESNLRLLPLTPKHGIRRHPQRIALRQPGSPCRAMDLFFVIDYDMRYELSLHALCAGRPPGAH